MTGDLWSYLKKAQKPLVMYGMGNGADKIISVLERYDMHISDFFASDDFVRGQFFHGKKVLNFSQIKEKYTDFIIIVSFATQLRDILDRIYELDREYELYAPDVPVVGENIFNSEFYDINKSFICEARNSLCDERSKSIFDDIIGFKLSGKLSYLKNTVSSPDEINREILSCDRYRICADFGAYKGDSVKQYIDDFPNVNKIYSFEPDKKNYKKLCAYIENEHLDFVSAYNCAAWDKNCEMTFSSGGNRNSTAFGNGTDIVTMRTPDSVFGNEIIDYIKYDVEGSEYNALQGTCRTIQRCSPDMLVSLYHRSEDIFKLILLVKKLNPLYRLFLRRLEYIPAWDLNLYAVRG